jgi:hypothetical protein
MESKYKTPLTIPILIFLMSGCFHPLQPAPKAPPARLAPPVQSVSSGKPEIQAGESPRELMVKEYLINKYKPGTCFGSPGPQEETDRHLIQLREIVLIKIDQGYGFILKDGHCCTVYSYQGKIIMDGDKIIEEKITNKSIDAIPC